MAHGSQRPRLPIQPTFNVAILPKLWSRRILLISPRFSPYDFFNRDAGSALLQLVNQGSNFIYSRFHAFRYGRKNTNSGFHKNRTHDFRTTKCMWLPTRPDHSGDEIYIYIYCSQRSQVYIEPFAMNVLMCSVQIEYVKLDYIFLNSRPRWRERTVKRSRGEKAIFVAPSMHTK